VRKGDWRGIQKNKTVRSTSTPPNKKAGHQEIWVTGGHADGREVKTGDWGLSKRVGEETMVTAERKTEALGNRRGGDSEKREKGPRNHDYKQKKD